MITMFYTYVLRSIKEHKFYTGQTDDLERRLQEHNSSKGQYSKRFQPWKIVYSEQFDTKEEAIKRERYFKSAAGRCWLKKNIRE